ncbi:unnamed protein product [Protopolystoma xenopodis]|uniref:Uncharacterized protein n=1 Tax=Protopolystoma xenopodis TaxID=117903 RepID=A0A3S5CVV8_9PLAT|nr:unnamed protein product [Protopolystoma xenopodis]
MLELHKLRLLGYLLDRLADPSRLVRRLALLGVGKFASTACGLRWLRGCPQDLSPAYLHALEFCPDLKPGRLLLTSISAL